MLCTPHHDWGRFEVNYRAFVWPVPAPVGVPPTQLRPNMPCKNIIFLVDTRAPCSELSPAACAVLYPVGRRMYTGYRGRAQPRRMQRPTGFRGGATAVVGDMCGIVNGVHCRLQLCAQDGSHPDIPVLGIDYLTLIGGMLTIDYRLHTVSIGRA